MVLHFWPGSTDCHVGISFRSFLLVLVVVFFFFCYLHLVLICLIWCRCVQYQWALCLPLLYWLSFTNPSNQWYMWTELRKGTNFGTFQASTISKQWGPQTLLQKCVSAFTNPMFEAERYKMADFQSRVVCGLTTLKLKFWKVDKVIPFSNLLTYTSSNELSIQKELYVNKHSHIWGYSKCAFVGRWLTKSWVTYS